MEAYFTLCSNNYLAYAKILGQSLKEQNPDSFFFIFLVDEKKNEIDYTSLADEVVPVSVIEPTITQLSAKYNIVELNTCLKPRVFEYLLFERNINRVIFLDPDVKVFSSLSFLFNKLNTSNILLTPHIYTPIPLDGKTPSENTFLNFGIYNLGFIGINNDAEIRQFLHWWREHTYRQGFIDVYKGIFVDQLPINLAPVFFDKVDILQDKGLNMAPWNLHERNLNKIDGRYMVNGKDELKFFHFSSFRPDDPELPLQHYNRFTLADRPDLVPAYKEYQQDLILAEHNRYKNLKPAYANSKKSNKHVSGWKKLFGRKD